MEVKEVMKIKAGVDRVFIIQYIQCGLEWCLQIRYICNDKKKVEKGVNEKQHN